MDIFSLLTMFGGLALFLYGMNYMGDSLVMLSGSKLEKILEKLTGNQLTGLLLGAGVTAVIQSSSATTVMVVGFVNSGIMKLRQAVGVIMGANIGTTVTSWLLSLTGVSGDNLFLKFLKPSSFSPILAVIGIILIMLKKNDTNKKNIGGIMLGFAILMFGMETMSDAVAPLAQNEAFTSVFTAFSNPILGMIIGAVLTAIIQSSSASVGILQALCLTGIVSFGSAIPIIMGQNIGTCVTALISSLGANKNAKRASFIHLYFNLIGTILFMIVFYSINSFVHFEFLSQPASAAGIAVIHSLFNIGCAIVLFPFGNGLVKLATLTVRDKKDTPELEDERPEGLKALDERFLDRPSFAISICRSTTVEMAKTARDSFKLAMKVLNNYSKEDAQRVIEMEQLVDDYEDQLGTFLVKLSGHDLTRQDSRTLSILLHVLNDFERISDHAINVIEAMQKLIDGGENFTQEAKEELIAFSKPVSDILDKTVEVFEKDDLEKAKEVEPLEEVIDDLCMEMKQRHINRLRAGVCSIEAGLRLEDILTNYERVSDHCSNVAVSLIEINADEFGTHAYINVKVKENDPWFQEEYSSMKEKYMLP